VVRVRRIPNPSLDDVDPRCFHCHTVHGQHPWLHMWKYHSMGTQAHQGRKAGVL